MLRTRLKLVLFGRCTQLKQRTTMYINHLFIISLSIFSIAITLRDEIPNNYSTC